MSIRKIRTPFSTPLDGSAQYSTKITNQQMDRIFEPIKANKISIFDTYQTIERYFNRIIAQHILGRFSEKGKIFRERFDSLILASDWCSFNSKLRLVLHIVEEGDVLSKKEIESYEKTIRKCMTIRNGFAHGHLSTDGTLVYLSYYQTKAKKEILNQEYFDQVEKYLNDGYYKTTEVAKKLEVIKTSE